VPTARLSDEVFRRFEGPMKRHVPASKVWRELLLDTGAVDRVRPVSGAGHTPTLAHSRRSPDSRPSTPDRNPSAGAEGQDRTVVVAVLTDGLVNRPAETRQVPRGAGSRTGSAASAGPPPDHRLDVGSPLRRRGQIAHAHGEPVEEAPHHRVLWSPFGPCRGRPRRGHVSGGRISNSCHLTFTHPEWYQLAIMLLAPFGESKSHSLPSGPKW